MISLEFISERGIFLRMGTIGTGEAAKQLGVSPRRIVQFIEQGRLKAHQIGRTWVIDERSLRSVEDRPGPGRPTGKAKHAAK